jgi:hypothetical protein
MDGARPAISKETLRLEIESVRVRLEDIFMELVELTLGNFYGNRKLPINVNILCETYDELFKQLEARRREAEAVTSGNADPSLLEANRLETGALQVRLDGVVKELGRQALENHATTRDLPRDIAVLCETYGGLYETMEARKDQLAEMEAREEAAREEAARNTAAQVQSTQTATPVHVEQPVQVEPPPPSIFIAPPVSIRGQHYAGPSRSKLLLPIYITVSIVLVVVGLHFFSLKLETPHEISFEGQIIYAEKAEPMIQEQHVDAWRIAYRLDKLKEGDSLRTAKSPVTAVKLLDNSLRLGPDSCVRFSSLRKSDNADRSMVQLEVPYGRVWIDKSASMRLMVTTKGGTLNAADLCSELVVDKNGDMKFIAWKGGGSYTDGQGKKTYKVDEGYYLTFKESGGPVNIEPWRREKRDAWQDWNLRYTVDEIYGCTVPPVEDKPKQP